MHRPLALAAILATALLAGCGATATQSAHGTPTSGTDCAVAPTCAPMATAPPTEPPTAAPTPVPGIGAAFTMTDGSGNSMDITLTKVTDPERANSFDAAPPGAHYIAAFFTITGDTGIFSSDVFNDGGAIDNAGTTVDSKVAAVNCSTDFSGSGQYSVTPGHSISGCVPFEVLNGSWLTDITWDASGGNGADWAGHF
jgi:hypothetical protein